MKKVSVAMIGIGGYGAQTLGDLLDSNRKDYEIIATVDPYPEVSRHFSRLQSMGIAHFSDIKQMYDAGLQPQLCIISSPIQFHKEQILCCRSHGASVLCEKPLTGDIHDLPALEAAANGEGFIAVGYQWSYSHAIQRLKSDIISGIYGKPMHLKTVVLWPRNRAYFTRSTGWAGKITASNGEIICDSVANNATAHYLHNILYVLGTQTDRSVCATDIQAELLRVNAIETFDTCAARFSLENGATGMYVVSHSTSRTVNPRFEYRFENGTVSFSEEQGEIIGHLDNGEILYYGNPFADRSKKAFDCIDAVSNGSHETLCGVRAASAQMHFISKLHKENKIHILPPDTITETAEGLLYVEGLDSLLLRCYEENKLPSEIGGLL